MPDIRLTVKEATGRARNDEIISGWAVFGEDQEKPMSFVFSDKSETEAACQRLKEDIQAPGISEEDKDAEDKEIERMKALWKAAFDISIGKS